MLVMPTKDALITLGRDSDYAKRHREHLRLVNELRALGAQVYADLDPPRIAVVGEQGAGKSSLIEAISGITTPRDATRCPIEFHMSYTPDSPWSSQVSIRWEFSTDGLPAKKVSHASFGPRLTDKADIELVLRRAQATVLNPQHDLQDFVTMSPEALGDFGANEVLYSGNVVCVELSGPELADVIFVDLPGIIRKGPPEDEDLVDDIVLSHITGDCTIVLVTSLDDDKNQTSAQLAKQVDPLGARTIGVFTKPDTIPLDASSTKRLWAQLLEGRQSPFALGEFFTRQPNEEERAAHIGDCDARKAESILFATTAPWCTSTHQHRLGTQKLVTAISAHLARGFERSLPKLATETMRLLTSCNSRLEMLPRPIPPEPFMFILSLVRKFSSGIHAFVNGSVDTTSLVRQNRASYANLKKRICSTAPLFVPHTHGVSLSSLPQGLLGIDDPADTGSGSSQITLSEVRHTIQSAVTRELPNNVPYAAKMSYVNDFQTDWSSIALEAAKSVHASLSQIVACLIKEHFAQYQFFEPHVRAAVESLVRDRFTRTCAQISRLLEYERTAFTQNDYYLSSAKERLLVDYQHGRLKLAMQAPPVSAQVDKAEVYKVTETHKKISLEELSSSSHSAVPARTRATGTKSEPTAFDGPEHPSGKPIPSGPTLGGLLSGIGLHPAAPPCLPDIVPPSTTVDVVLPDYQSVPAISEPVEKKKKKVKKCRPACVSNSSAKSTAIAADYSAQCMQAVPIPNQQVPCGTPSASTAPAPAANEGILTDEERESLRTDPFREERQRQEREPWLERTVGGLLERERMERHARELVERHARERAEREEREREEREREEREREERERDRQERERQERERQERERQERERQEQEKQERERLERERLERERLEEQWRQEQQREEQERKERGREEQERAEQERAQRQRDQRMHDEALALEVLARLGFKNLTTTDFEKLKGPRSDDFDEELEVMAEVRAYFKVAYKRVIDIVPLAIDHELLYAFANELEPHLISTLGLSSGDVARKSAVYLAEDPGVVAERDELLARKERLMNIQAQLRDAGVSG